MREGPRWLYWVRILAAIGFGWLAASNAASLIRLARQEDIEAVEASFAVWMIMVLVFCARGAYALWRAARPRKSRESHRITGWITTTAGFHLMLAVVGFYASFGADYDLTEAQMSEYRQATFALATEYLIVATLALVAVHAPGFYERRERRRARAEAALG